MAVRRDPHAMAGRVRNLVVDPVNGAIAQEAGGWWRRGEHVMIVPLLPFPIGTGRKERANCGHSLLARLQADSTRKRHPPVDRRRPNLAGRRLAALGNRNIDANTRSFIASWAVLDGLWDFHRRRD